MEDYTETVVPGEDIGPIIEVFMDLGDLFPESQHSMFGTDTPMRLLRLSYQLIHRFSDQAKRFEIFKSAITNANQSIFTVSHEVGVQCQQHGKYNLKSTEPDPEDQRTVNSTHLLELEWLAQEKIEAWARDGRLSAHPRLVSILYDWKRWSPPGEKDVRAFVNELLTTNEGLVTVITGFTGRQYISGYSDYVSREKSTISLDALEEWVSVADIEPRVRSIVRSDRFTTLTADQQRALKTFLDTVDGKERQR
jgi:predicted KAP-like P-loop ATPase